ncbi:MAG: hypothetical protein A3C07_04700 [Candidatus Sungbacteria bacterium RIFCSPHIGHO2_02_FULL_47_11]|uniref:Uncharacterized protein n=1 Tax=Candidatus Sungbacteria bacterium RIFCSPHIGHO2_02_FULL_47_11 TaxID=1802270 RepID=A0A1G2KKF5_9BACT|nr:MAG: hypothetical protein A3C07_04700 [Candidatus Sungbacteria bacterium RIFCSPHIGHO2_02_FULL_47_11]
MISTILTPNGVILVSTYWGAYWISKKTGWEENRRQKTGDAIGVLFAVSLLVFIDVLLFRVGGVSFFSLLMHGNNIPVVVFVAGGVLGTAYEYIGQFALKRWYYPSAQRKKILLLVLPIFWGIFMLILQDTWGIFRTIGLEVGISITLTAITHFALIEGINIFTNSWVYTGWARSPVALFLGWIVLVLTFVIGFNRFFINPFGL